MDDARLHRGLREDCSDRVRQPLEPVADDKEHVVDAAVLQLGEHLDPELCRLPAAGAGPQPEDVLVAGQVDPDRGVERPVRDLAVADLDVDRVDEDRGVHLLQRPRGPFGHLGQHPVGDLGDGVLGQRGAVDLLEVRRHLAGSQALRDQRQHDRVDPSEPSLPLLHDHRVEGAVPIPRHLDLDRADRLGQHRLGPDPVARVPAPTPGRMMLVVAEVLGHLLIKRGLEDRLGQRLQHPTRTGHRHPPSAGGPDQLTGDRQLLSRRLDRLSQHHAVRPRASDRRLRDRWCLDQFLNARRAHARQCFGHQRPFPANQPVGVSSHLHR